MTVTLKTPPGKPWVLVATDLGALTKTLGEDVVRAFCRCFVSADRLTSLAHFIVFNDQHLPHESISYERNLQTAHWLITGVMWEMKDALDALDNARVVALMSDPSPWTTLKQTADRWASNPTHRSLRNKVAFHVDPGKIREGLRKLSSEKDIVLVTGDDDKLLSLSAQIGAETLITGMDLSPAERQAVISDIGQDLHEVPSLLFQVFEQVLKTQKLL
jgi:hypothetical protein